MQITKQQLKQIIKEELQTVLNEGSLTYAKQQLSAAGAAASYNPWLKSFQRLKYLSGPEDSLVNWISQAESSKDSEAKRALNKVNKRKIRMHAITKELRRKQTVATTPMREIVFGKSR